MEKPELFELEVIQTPDGVLTPIYKEWEDWHKGYSIKMAYTTSLRPAVVKGPILHERRGGMISCVYGDVTVECMYDNKIVEYNLGNKEKRYVLLIPAGTPNRIINNSSEDNALILNLPNKAWHPKDEDTIKFKSWDDVMMKYNQDPQYSINSDGAEK
jgi:dTDP-4-dehydrorhamnose 3,5-epimerase-like enzyme